MRLLSILAMCGLSGCANCLPLGIGSAAELERTDEILRFHVPQTKWQACLTHLF